MNLGTVGFLLNSYREDGLLERLNKAVPVPLHPLRMRAQCRNGQVEHGLGINEVSLFRQTRQAANLRIEIDGVMRLEQLVCDGILVATAAGSTAYNLSRMGRSCPSAPTCWRSRRSARFARGAGAALCCRATVSSGSAWLMPTNARLARSPTTPKSAT